MTGVGRVRLGMVLFVDMKRLLGSNDLWLEGNKIG